MKRRLLLLFLIGLLGALGKAGAACVMPGGMGGTGISAHGGIGGTGIRADADLSLIGVVTGLGSICVNGVEVHYDGSTPVTLDGEPSSAGVLAVGHVVALHAFGNGIEARARAVDIFSAAVGRVTAMDRPGSPLQVFGQPVRIEAWTTFGPGFARPTPADIGLGEPLRVSGLRRADGTIVATRIERAPSARESTGDKVDVARLLQGEFIVQGYVSDSAAGELHVGGMPFRAPPQITEQLSRDRLVRLSGRTQADGARIVERAEILTAPLDPRPERTLSRTSGSGPGSDRVDRRGQDRSGPDRAERPDRSGPDRPERPERGSDRVERPERVDRSGRH